MKHIGFKQVALSSIVVPGDFNMKDRIDSDHVRELAVGLKQVGQLNPLVVVLCGEDYVLTAGGDRYAAHVVAKKKRVWITIYEADERETLELHLIENAHRRHSPEEYKRVRQQLIDLYSASPEAAELPEEKKESAVRKRVADAMGVDPKSVQRAQQRKRQKEGAPVEQQEPPILTHGISLSAEWHAGVLEYHRLLDDATTAIRRSQQLVAQAARHPYARQQEMLRLHEDVTKAATAVRTSVPKSICPYCKALDGVMDECVPCGGTALVSVAQWESAPKELTEKMGADGFVYYQAKKYSVTEWVSAHQREPEPEDGEVEIEGDPLSVLDGQ